MRRKLRSFFIPRSFWEWIAVTATVVVATLGGYWSIIDRQPAGMSSSEIVTPWVRPGGEFTIRYRVQWNSTCRVTGYRFIIDSAGQQYTVAPDTRFISPQDAPVFTISVPIPRNAQPGPAVYRATVFYECNPLQRWFPLERKIEDKPFAILPADGSDVETGSASCPMTQPVFVRSYCRRKPVALIQ